MVSSDTDGKYDPPQTSLSRKHYRNILIKTILRLVLTYLVPLAALIIYFQVQYSQLQNRSMEEHLKTVAESQSKTLDLFLRERVVNLLNLIDDPRMEIPPTNKTMQIYLDKLRRDSDAFMDIGYFDESGVQKRYAGPYPQLQKKDYGEENWYKELLNTEKRFLITNIYLGFRQKPHFTIGAKRRIEGRTIVMRATLDPTKICNYIESTEGAADVAIAIVNAAGEYQIATEHLGCLLADAEFTTPEKPHKGLVSADDKEESIYGYSWLSTVDWAVVVKSLGRKADVGFFEEKSNQIIVSVIIIAVAAAIIVLRARKFVEIQKEKDIARLQLERASRLASVGELAAGIAHEINNPLAIIDSETGLMKDMYDPDLPDEPAPKEVREILDNITEAVFRGRDITSKLLSFVRRHEIRLEPNNVNKIIEDIVDGFYQHELELSNIKLIKRLDPDLPEIRTEPNQLKQVLLNLINNARDAISPPGKITIETSKSDDMVKITVNDTGSGIPEDKLDKIFLPFFTTKEAGKGTGLGLSVSYNIIRNLGGSIDVESIPGVGSAFTISLPIGE
jgi:two-component system NtrC family sensor kinase